jgi:hypothetical protein
MSSRPTNDHLDSDLDDRADGVMVREKGFRPFRVGFQVTERFARRKIESAGRFQHHQPVEYLDDHDGRSHPADDIRFNAAKTGRTRSAQGGGPGEVIDKNVRVKEDGRAGRNRGQLLDGHQNGRNSSLSATSATAAGGAGISPRVSATAPGWGEMATRTR